MRNLLLLSALTCALIAAVGCPKSGPSGKAKFVPVEGVVTINGEPAAGVQVTFRPKQVDPRTLEESLGTTDAEGKFTIKTGEKDGCPEGEYFIGFSKVEGTEQLLMQYCRPIDSGFSVTVSASMESPTFDLK
ncbi:MAG: hypothetical protein IJM54_10210 [Thermoguttaceae bacterium]|nr:hypothetical protein [Thermoguttaceae bacterium]MBR4752503.1 hypothetical protein [Thermoguttaceae bacterium]MBR5758458.1 hypothetical protein [Thermoguttaceae bacterium]